MIIRKNLDWRVVVRITWRHMLTLFFLSLAAYWFYKQYGEHASISTVPVSILGVAISFLIGFRVNSAYERWWEARKLWGALVNESRTFARQVLTFITPRWSPALNEQKAEELRKDLIYGQIGFVYALKCSLRRQDPLEEIRPYFTTGVQARFMEEKNLPNAILLRQSKLLEHSGLNGHTDDFRLMQLDSTLSRISDAMGGCERIKNTVFPRQYGVYTTAFTRIYAYMLPFILVPTTGILVIPFTLLIGFIFYALDSIARGIENPFENTYNDTPMSTLCRTIEINLRQMLGEQELPEPIQPINGFLY